ncbi:hypothetical protein LZ198_23410 [Myxococcus sp. K15C18031901]|uniref:type VI secretion system protein IglI family protein n=1 Tax=Myxococcus dinghuensis TaxID=2906761 RepID=UPI0020A72F49|nr:type VI secretion system protein IglI family protein [Myxococcus dinghuensis]MCP3101829.1 hypothetical protein [Myxococcus dinghuensis]
MADASATQVPFDGTLLERALSGEPPQDTSPDEPDARLDAVTDAISSGDYDRAACGAEALLRAGVNDARIIGPYLFGAFRERGLVAMPSLFRSLQQVLTTSFPALGPVSKRDVFLDTGLRWLLRTLNKHLTYSEQKKDAAWQRWCEADIRPPLEAALALTDAILTALPVALPKNGCEEPFRNLANWLKRHVDSLPAAPAAAAAAQTADLTAASNEDAPRAGQDAKRDAPPTRAAPPPPPAPGIPLSPALELLLRKLDAFSVLLARGEMTKAGVVAADVLTTVERFDPRLYLPTLFTRFYAGLSTHARGLEPFLHNSDALPMRALEQLYRVDLDAFLAQSEGEPEEEED